MGMHFGVIATDGRAEDLLGALARAGTFRAGADVASMDDVPERDAAGEHVIVAGDHRGRAYLMDPGLVLAVDADLVVDMSKRLSGRVLAIGAETTSGTYWLTLAHDGQLERAHWEQLGGLTVPFDVGSRLPGEPDDGLDDVDGERLRGVLAAAGFDLDGWMSSGRKVVVDATYGDAPRGPAGDAMNAHFEAHGVEGSEKLRPVVAKRGSGFDLVAPGSRLPDGTRVVAPEEKPGLLGRLFGRR